MENNIVKVKLWGQEVGLTFHEIIQKGWIHIEEKELIHLVETYLRLK